VKRDFRLRMTVSSSKGRPSDIRAAESVHTQPSSPKSRISREKTCMCAEALLNFRSRKHLARIIACANQKGGVGKTTTAVNLAACLAASEQPTLLIDCDSQANATAAIGFPKDPSRRTLYNTLIMGESFDKIVQKSQVEGLDVIPADKNLAGAAVELVNAENREYKLQTALKTFQSAYRFVVLDCPPALDLLTLNALVCASSVLVPIQCEYLALEGVSELLDTLMRIRRTLNPKLEIEGILLTMFDERTTLSRQVATDLRSFFGSQVFQAVISRNVRLAEAPSFGKPIIFYDIHSKGAEGYTQLAQEVIANDEKRAGTGARSAHSGA
jgi:chromosome partitioning protein